MTNTGFIFDMNGTMIDDMDYHAKAWHQIITALGSEMTEAEAKWQVYGKADEMFERVFGKNHRFTEEDIYRICKEKELRYQKDFLPHLRLIDGLDKFIESAYQKNIPLSIGTAAPRSNVDYVFKHLPVEQYFPVVISAEDVTRSKPDPEVFLKCAALMQLPPENCIVFEDSPKGVEAAANAGMRAVAITSFHPKEDFGEMPNVLYIIDNYFDERLQQLF